jgi:hypothetical protein
LRIDHPIPGGDPPERVDQLICRSVFDQEARYVRGERPAQGHRPSQHRQDHHPAVRQPLVQLGGGGEPVHARHVHVEQGQVGAVSQSGRHDSRARRHLGDHFDVILQVQQRDQRVPQDPHVLRDQDPDHLFLRPAGQPAP